MEEKTLAKGRYSHLEHKYVCDIHPSGILFTAPHSKRLVRGGLEYKK